MIYKNLSKYYDQLFSDNSSYEKWVNLVKKNITGNKIIELACGSGDVSYKLSKYYDVLATDISKDMLNIVKEKYPNLKVMKMDMKHVEGNYDGVICFCDSINYLSSLEECEIMFKSVYECLTFGGKFIFDIHSIDRIDEFKNGYIEEGYVEGVPYSWEISLDINKLYHTFAFYLENDTVFEQHIQTIFDINDIISIMKNIGFNVEVYTDFDKKGITKGEKYFLIGGKI